MEVVVGGNTWDTPPQGILWTIVFMAFEWAIWKLRADLCAGHFDVFFGRVD